MADVHDTGYLSIGEVLGLLLEEFPDVTISKIRFLESQGLISPERTASGYRKFYDHDVELLRVILTEQRSNYLPLRVIKDRLETGEIDPTGEHLRPNGDGSADGALPAEVPAEVSAEEAEVPTTSVAAHPAARGSASSGGPRTATSTKDGSPTSAQLMPGVLVDRTELCAMVGMTDSELEQLEGFGLVVAREGSSPPLYGEDAVAISKPASEFLRAGVDARHLRTWRTAAEREASLFEQLVTPRFRQRNPESRAEALEQLRHLDELGGALRGALMQAVLRRHFES